MRPTEKIDELFERSKVTVSADADKKMIGDALTAIKQKDRSAEVEPGAWRIIMRSKFTKLAVAAVIIAGVMVGLHLSGRSVDVAGKVYAMSDVPQLWYSAETIHMKGLIYYPASGSDTENQISVEVEHWLDAANGRWRSMAPTCVVSSNEPTKVMESETICDGGEYEILLDHSNKKMCYFRVSDFIKQYTIKKKVNMLLLFGMGKPEIFDSYEKIGEAVIDGEMCDVWEYLLDLEEDGSAKIYAWLSPRTGDLKKSEIWQGNGDGKWVKYMEVISFERNATIPPDIFVVEIPADYKQDNTPETAKEHKLGAATIGIGDYWLKGQVANIMANGAIIFGWSSGSWKQEIDFAGLFEGLVIGGDFPKLPAEFHSLSVKGADKRRTYKGCHLAYTKKGDKYYEWGLYVPTEDATDMLSEFRYRQFIPEYTANVKIKGSATLYMNCDFLIENEDDFEAYVRGAMRELSDNPDAGSQLNYQMILGLSEELGISATE